MSTATAFRTEIEAWIDEHWDPDLTVGAWWRQLAAARYAFPALPEPWGRGFDSARTRELRTAFRERGVVGPPGGIGTTLALPTILAHGTDDQIARFVPPLIDGSEGWCQLFSEPGAGSDLAGITTRAVRDGDEWVVEGQKVWTSTGQHADWAILIARTDPSRPKHQGITYFLFPMAQSGVDVRPLREMTGRALFNEVFLDGARVASDLVLGGLDNGWRVANTTLTHERSGIGDNETGFGRAIAGSLAGHLERRVGDFVKARGSLAMGGVGPGSVARLNRLARELGRDDDPVVRQGLARLHTELEIIRLSGQRAKHGGARTGGEGNLAKIRMTNIIRLARQLGGLICGPHAQLWGPNSMTEGWIQEFTTYSPAPSIYGGTDEIQRNIIGERVLGLPKEPGPARDTPFSELLTNR